MYKRFICREVFSFTNVSFETETTSNFACVLSIFTGYLTWWHAILSLCKGIFFKLLIYIHFKKHIFHLLDQDNTQRLYVFDLVNIERFPDLAWADEIREIIDDTFRIYIITQKVAWEASTYCLEFKSVKDYQNNHSSSLRRCKRESGRRRGQSFRSVWVFKIVFVITLKCTVNSWFA